MRKCCFSKRNDYSQQNPVLAIFFVSAYESPNIWPPKYSSLLITPMIHSLVAIKYQKHTIKLEIQSPASCHQERRALAMWPPALAFSAVLWFHIWVTAVIMTAVPVSLPCRRKGSHQALENGDPRHPLLRAVAILCPLETHHRPAWKRAF